MRLLELSLATPEENLALDEALLEQAERNAKETEENSWELLRLWELNQYCVVVGRSSKISQEVNLATAQEDGCKVLRRGSGGSSVVVGPGCLLYSVLLSYEADPGLRSLDWAHRRVMTQLQRALWPRVPGVQMEGTCDLTWQGKKFSGNALRCKRRYLLYHGTVLYGFDLPRISRYLLEPPRQPEYRLNRPHHAFVTNLPIEPGFLRQSLIEVWRADEGVSNAYDGDLLRELLHSRYGNPQWHRLDS